MASISPTTGSASALIKSSISLSQQIQSYQDSIQAFQYANSAYTDEAFSAYKDYLQGRINALNSAGGIANAQKALTLTRALDSAGKSNISASITRENIQVMSGNATPMDKYNVITSQYVRAVGNGDLTLAQSLESQAYSLSQTIQLQRQNAADAATTLAKASASATAGGQEHIATNLEFSLNQLNNDIKSSGQKDFNSVVQKWVAANADTLKALGVALPKGAAPNYFDIVNGVQGAIYNAHMLAYTAEAPYNPDTAQTYYNSAIKVATTGTLPTLAGNKTAKEIQQAATNPNQFSYDQNTGKFIQNAQTGNTYNVTLNPNGSVASQGVQPTYGSNVKQVTVLTPQQTSLMTKFGLDFSMNKNGTTGNGVEVQATNQTPTWLKTVLGNNTVTNMYTVPNPQDPTKQTLQFQADATNGTGKAVYTVITDQKGLHALAEESNAGTAILGGEYGYNAQPPGVSKNGQGFFSSLLATSRSSLTNFASLSGGGNATAQSLINQGQIVQHNAATAAAAQASALLMASKPSPLPPLPVVSQPAPQTNPVAQAAPQTTSILQKTTSPQTAAPIPGTGTYSPQSGGGFNLNQSGGSVVKVF